MTVKRRVTAGLAACLLSIGSGAFMATTPAQAAPADCPSVGWFCLFNADESEASDVYPGNIARNTCRQLGSFNDDLVWNGTNTRWYLFRTTTCNGSHAEIPPNYAGPLPVGYDSGSTHAIMRTSRTS